MSIHRSAEALRAVAVPAPVLPGEGRPGRAERTFGLPPRLLVATIGAYFAFLAIMAAVFMNPNLILPFSIFIIYLVMAFGVPSLWARIAGRPAGRFQTWDEFRAEGMEIETGHISGGGAMAQVLTLPVLILGWGLAVAIIAVLV